jgi:hypothetical protein
MTLQSQAPVYKKLLFITRLHLIQLRNWSESHAITGSNSSHQIISDSNKVLYYCQRPFRSVMDKHHISYSGCVLITIVEFMVFSGGCEIFLLHHIQKCCNVIDLKFANRLTDSLVGSSKTKVGLSSGIVG